MPSKSTLSQKSLFLRNENGESAGKKKRVAGGIATSDVIVSAYQSGNADVFPKILKLHVPVGSVIADVTWGKGVFWQKVIRSKYTVHATDLQTGVDCRDLPYDDVSLDCVVLDPPYMEGLFRKDTGHLAAREHTAHFESTIRTERRPTAVRSGTMQCLTCISRLAARPFACCDPTAF